MHITVELVVGAIVALVVGLLLDHWFGHCRPRRGCEDNDDPTEGLDL